MSLWRNSVAAYRRGERGFSLIEVVVALGLLAIVTAALVPQVIVGVRAAATARDVTQAKGVAQGKLEEMRNMPYFVGRAVGDYIDVLDTYYRSTAPPTVPVSCMTGGKVTYAPATWTGFVADGTARCPYEPQTGAFYRKVINPVVAPGLGEFAMVITTQFLSAATPPAPVPPSVNYNSQTAGSDVPGSPQVGVTATVIYRTQSGPKYVSTFTQINQRTPVAPTVLLNGTAEVVRVSSTLLSGNASNLTVSAGVVNNVGELYTGSRAASVASAGTASKSNGSRIQAANASAVAPPDISASNRSALAMGLEFGCLWACFGATDVSGVSAVSSDGLPRAGTPTSPVTARIPSGVTNNGFRFNNEANSPFLGLGPSRPVVTMDTSAPSTTGYANCAVTATAPPAHMLATGYLNTTLAPFNSLAESCVTAQAKTIVLFPTDDVPTGIVRIDLERGSAYCGVATSGSTRTPTATADYRAVVSYWNGSRYDSIRAVDKSNRVGFDPLQANNLLTRSVGNGRVLGDYIASWRSSTLDDIEVTKTANSVQMNVPGIITLDTQPTRTGDPTSVVSVQIGALACKASDSR